MAKYFSYFPRTVYNENTSVDLSARAKFFEENFNDPYMFLPYTVREGEAPEDIAYLYYGTVDATWMVMLANNVIDPYHDWVMSYADFEEYIAKKYESQSGLKGFDVVAWTQNQTITDNILFYYKEVDGSLVKRSPESFPTEYALGSDGLIVIDVDTGKPVVLSRTIDDGWMPARIYDFEFQMNENKREIRLVERQYYQKALKEFKATMSR